MLGVREGTGHCLAITSWSCPSPARPPHARPAAGSGPGRWEDGCSLPAPGLSALSSLRSVGGLIWKQLKFCAEAAQAAGAERSQRRDRNQLVWIKSATDKCPGVPLGWRLRPQLRPHTHPAPHGSPRQEVSAGSPQAAPLGPPRLQLRSAVGNRARAWPRVCNGWFGVSGGAVTVGPQGRLRLERAAEAAYGEGAAPRAHLWPRCVRTQGAAVGLRLRELPGPSEGPPASTGSKGCGGRCATCPGAWGRSQHRGLRLSVRSERPPCSLPRTTDPPLERQGGQASARLEESWDPCDQLVQAPAGSRRTPWEHTEWACACACVWVGAGRPGSGHTSPCRRRSLRASPLSSGWCFVGDMGGGRRAGGPRRPGCPVPFLGLSPLPPEGDQEARKWLVPPQGQGLGSRMEPGVGGGTLLTGRGEPACRQYGDQSGDAERGCGAVRAQGHPGAAARC